MAVKMDSTTEFMLKACGASESQLDALKGKYCDEVPQPDLITFLVGERRWPPLAICCAVLLVYALLYTFHYYWRKLQKERQERSEILASAEKLGVSIATRFLPSTAVDAYRFRGMKPKSATISIKFNQLGLRLNDGRSVLDGVSGEFKHSRMAAIMGPSGAGKTTFMNVLCGKATYGQMCGQALFNDGAIDLAALKPAMGFVPQDDVVHERLTVRENIHFAAQLKNPPETSADHIDAIVEDVLNVLQVGHIQSSLVGSVEERGISGGQRKRVNIGLELAACPTLLFLDEPTSGLDSTSSLQIINSLGKMTQLKMTIIMVIHQPRYPLFTLFDDVLLLGPGGRTVYLGPSGTAKDYFEGLEFKMPACENPADWLMDILSGSIETTKVKDFKPSMLFEWWEQGAAKVATGTERRHFTNEENRSVLVHMIDDEWDKIDSDHSGALDLQELRALLTSCCHHQPPQAAVLDIMTRIAGPSQHASKQDMVDYVFGLLSSVAIDKAVVREATSSFPDGQTRELAVEATDVTANLLPAVDVSSAANLVPKRPGFCRQFQIILTRRLTHFFREGKQRLVDVVLVTACATGVGLMHSGSMGTDKGEIPSNLLIFYMGLALLASTSSLKVFGSDRPIFWRERASGLNVLAFFCARVCGHVFDVLLQSTIYSVVYFCFVRPPVAFVGYFIPCLLVSFCAAGWGHCISVAVPPSNSTLATVICGLLFCGIIGDPRKLSTMTSNIFQEAFLVPSLSRWAIPMTLRWTLNVAETSDACIHPILKDTLDDYEDITPNGVDDSVWVMSTTAVALYIAGYLGLRFSNRSKSV